MAYTTDEFAERIKAKYPQYANINNAELTNKIISKYPEYKAQVSFEQPNTTPTPQPKPQPKPTLAPKPTPKVQTQTYQTPVDSDPISAQYDVIANDTTLSKEQKIAKMNELKTSIDKDINKQKRKDITRVGGGALLQSASMHPIFNIPYIGTGIGGALFDAGSAIMEGKSGKDIAKQAGRGFVIGETIGAIPYVGKAAAKTKAGQAAIGTASKVGQKFAETGVGKAVGKAVTKTGEVLSKEIPTPFTKQKPVVTPQAVEQVVPIKQQKTKEIDLDAKEKREQAFDIISNALGGRYKKSYIKGLLESTNPKTAKTREKIIQEIRESADKVSDVDAGEWTHYSLGNSGDEVLGGEKLASRALDDILNNNFESTATKYNREMQEYSEFLEEQAKQQAQAMKQRGAVTTIENKFGKDVADQITDRTYEVRGKAVNKAEFEALAPEQQSQLINNADDLSDLATYAKAEYIKNRLANGEVPTSMLNNWVKGGTEKAQALQAQKWLAPDTVEGAMVKAQSVIREAQPKQVKKLLDSADDIVKKSKGKTRKQVDDLLKVKETRSLRRKNIVDGIMELDKKGQLTSENLTKLINKKYKVPEITDNDVKEFERLTTNIKNATTEREKNIAEALLNKHIVDKVPVGFADKDQTYRTINMLLSPQSRSKDILGTTLYQGERFLDEAFAKIPAAISRVRGFKTRTLGFQNKAWREGLKRGWQEVNEDIKLGINTGRSGEGARYDLTSRPSFEGTPVLGASEKLLNRVIRGVDRPLYEAAYNASIADQLAVQGLKEPTKEIIEQAIKEARQAVFQGDSIAAKLGLGIRNVLNAKGTPLEKLRLGQRNIPFLQTVSNITTEGLKASPAGLPYSLIKYARAKTVPELREAELEIGKALKGAALYGTGGYALAQMAPEQTNIGQLGGTNYMGDDVTGLPQQGIAIGDKAISLASMPQVGIPLTMWKSVFEKGTPSQKIANMLMQGSNVLMDLPAFKGVGDIVKSGADINKAIGEVEQTGDYSGVKEAANKALQQYAANQLSQYIPFGGFLGNIRNAVDPYRRELYTDDTLEYLGNRIVNRIPLASSTLPIKYNVIGEPSMMNNIENPLARTASALIDPLSFRNYTPRPQSMTDLDALRQYAMENDITGKTTLKYEKAKRKIGTKKSGQVKLTNEQYSEYQRILGTNMKGNLEALMQTERYKKASEKAKIKMVRDVRKRVKEDAEAKIKNAIRENML